MSFYIYRTAETPAVKHSPTRYAYEDDPTFLSFRSAVCAVCDKNEQPHIDNSKLYALWYVSKTFHRHWDERPSKKTSNDMIFIVGHNFLTEMQSRIVLLAWLKLHFPNLTPAAHEKWEDDLFWPTWDRIQPSVQSARDHKNARRREKRKKKTMTTQNAQRKATLKGRILEALKQYPMTTTVLAAKLTAHPKAVDGHLSRMCKRGELIKLGRGLYALPGVVDSAHVEAVNAVSAKPRTEPITLAENITEGVATWKEPPVLEPADAYTVDIPVEDGVLTIPDMKTADPRWSQNWWR